MIFWEVVLVTTAATLVVVNGWVPQQSDVYIEPVQEKENIGDLDIDQRPVPVNQNLHNGLVREANDLDNSQIKDSDDLDNTGLVQEQHDLDDAGIQHASDKGLIREKNDLDISTITDTDDLDNILLEEQHNLDDAGISMDKTGLSRNPDKRSLLDLWESRFGIKSCSPTVSCTHAGGHCFTSGSTCNGTVDAYGCIGGGRCMCCIPVTTSTIPTTTSSDTDTTAPPTTTPTDTTTTTTPTTTTAAPTTTDTTTTTTPTTTTAAPTTPTTDTTTTTPTTTTAAPTTTTTDTTTTTTPTTTTAATTTTTTDTTTTTTAPTTTTTATTTTPPDITCPGTKVDAGQDLVCSRHTYSTWQQAYDYCTSIGLTLAQPKDVFNVADKLFRNNGRKIYYWIGATGTGTHQRWLNGTDLDSSLYTWRSGSPLTSTSDCLFLLSDYNTKTVLVTYPCTTWWGYVLCD